MRKPIRPRGFTLIELIMVIVMLGIVGGMVAVFMRGPIDAYLASGRRANLTDVADTTVRRMARDLRTALPNSIRPIPNVPANQCFEFIPTKTGGRYRTEDIVAGDDSSLNFAAADTTFNMLGDNNALPAEQRITAGDIVVVYNLGIPGASAYANNNTAVVAAAPAIAVAGAPPETTIPIPATLFPLASGGNRFHVVPAAEPVVGYVCPGDGTLRRYVRALPYAAPAACPNAAAVAASPRLASGVVSCSFVIAPPDLQRNALVSLSLQISEGGETVSLQSEVHVNNTP